MPVKQPYDARCSRVFDAYHHSGPRTQRVLWIVLHDAESDTAESTARYLSTKASGGSAHLAVDDNECYRLLDNNIVAWGAPGANEAGFHIEQAGFARWGGALWLAHLDTLKRAAWKTARHCVVFNLPPRFVVAEELRRGLAGVTTHAECTKAFGGDHTDPGVFWPRRVFMRYVRDFHAQLTL